MSIKLNLENMFESLAIRILNNPWKVIVSVSLLTLLLAINLSKVYIDVSNESFFYENDPTFINYENFQEEFGRETGVILALDPPRIWDLNFLRKLKSLHEELEQNVPYLDEVTSLINITAIRGTEGELIVEDLLIDNWPENSNDLLVLDKYTNSVPLYENTILSKNGKQTVIIISADVYAPEQQQKLAMETAEMSYENENVINNRKTKLSPTQINHFVNTIKDIAEQYRSKDFSIRMGGEPIIDKAHSEIVHNTVGLASVGIFITILIMLGLVFRRVSGVLLPLTIIVLSFILTLSFMGLANIPMTLISQTFPPLLLAFGVLDAVHFLTIFFKQLESNVDKRQALIKTMKNFGPAMFFTSITTSIGFLSFYGAEIRPVSDLGMVAPIGIMSAFFYTVLLIPAIFILAPIKLTSVKLKTVKPKRNSWTQRIEKSLHTISSNAAHRPKIILLCTGLLLIFAGYGINDLRFSFNTLKMFTEGYPVRVDAEWIDEKMGSSLSFEVIVDTRKENGLLDPVVLNKMEQMNRFAESLTFSHFSVAKSTSLVDTLKQINRSLHENKGVYYSIPQQRNLIAQEILLFENGGSDDLEELVDSLFSKARITIRLPNADAVDYLPLRRQLINKYEQVFLDKAKITVTGSMDLSTRSIVNVMEALGISYLIAGLSITILMILFLASVKMGLISMLPNLFPVLLTLGIMGWLDIPIDMMTLLGGSVALGIAVDDTVHFMYKFKHFFDKFNDSQLSIKYTIDSVGRAIFFTTVIMVTGFLVFIFVPLVPIRNFGLLTAFTMVTALLSDLLIAPALVTIFYRNKMQDSKQQQASFN